MIFYLMPLGRLNQCTAILRIYFYRIPRRNWLQSILSEPEEGAAGGPQLHTEPGFTNTHAVMHYKYDKKKLNPAPV